MSEDTQNTSNRASIINSVIKEVLSLEADRKKISEEIRAVKQKKIKADLGMKITDFNAALRLASLEGEDRDSMLDTIRETFEALGIGDQLDWINASERHNAGASVEVEGEEAV